MLKPGQLPLKKEARSLSIRKEDCKRNLWPHKRGNLGHTNTEGNTGCITGVRRCKSYKVAWIKPDERRKNAKKKKLTSRMGGTRKEEGHGKYVLRKLKEI